MPTINEPPGNWPWDWDFRNNESFSRGRSLRRQDSCSRSSSILSDCLSEASRQHEKEASFTRSESFSNELRSLSTPSECAWVPASPMRTSRRDENHETTSLSQVDMWLSQVPRQAWNDSSPATLTCPTCGMSFETVSELKCLIYPFLAAR
ncbi:hypothetical protein DL98DRAFT_299115 [Cadophora sp. DSE1049]|nr:hypothetical protein DL98DRAFT_299115 [Cadophora sp. DSE1049]